MRTEKSVLIDKTGNIFSPLVAFDKKTSTFASQF
jgi:hypothetical protein